MTNPIPRRLFGYAVGLGALIAVTACGSTNPYDVPEDEAAFLQNRVVKEARSMYAYQFLHADDEFLTTWTKNEFHVRYTIPPGQISVHVKITYYPRLMALGAHYMSGNMREIHTRVSFDAYEGETYQVACEIKNNLAYVWIEDIAGNRVSGIVTASDYYGYGLPDPAQ